MNSASPRGPSSLPLLTGRCRDLGVAAFALAALSTSVQAGGSVDYQVQRVEVTQSIQAGPTRLVGGRPTFVRATIRVTGGGTIQDVDGILRVRSFGADIPTSPFYTTNGPLLVSSGIPNYNNIDATLNFVFIPPVSPEVTLTVTVNPPGPNLKIETDNNNNSLTTQFLNFESQALPEHVYVPIDYRPTGGKLPNPPDPNLIEPGVGDNFVQAIYPGPDWNYHRSVAPTKLWTSSLSGSGSSLLTALAADLNLTTPTPDFIYGWVPGGLPYNGQAQISGVAAMGNTETFRHQRTFAHEVGHNFGLSHNSFLTTVIGIDVEHHLAITEGLPQVKPANLNDIMVPGLSTFQAWVRPGTHDFVFNDSAFNDAEEAAPAGPSLMVTGLWNNQTGAIEIADLLTFEGGRLTKPAPMNEADLIVRAYSGGSLLQELPIFARSSLDDPGGCVGNTDSWELTDPRVSFVAVLPAEAAGATIDRLAIVDPSTDAATAPFQLLRSSAEPEVALTTPGFQLDPAGTFTLAWQASDADGDPLKYYVRYSPNGGARMVPVATGITESVFEVNLAELPAFQPGLGFFEVLATDGLNTVRVQSPALESTGGAEGGVGSAPFTYIMSPDSGKTFQFGATVILHGSAWDLEDLLLNGGDVVWTSDVQGVVGSGRVALTKSLSVGTHVLTLAATDGDGNQSTDTTTVTITARGLPPNIPLCDVHPGLSGTGAATFSLCNPPSAPTGSEGTSLRLAGAAPNQAAWILAGPQSVPTPVLGGTLVPHPITLVFEVSTDANGALALDGLPYEALRGLTFQILYTDPAGSHGFGFTNAVRLEL